MTTWAIVIGIDRHPAGAEFPDLKGAVADAKDFANWLLEADGAAMPAKQLFFWTYPAPTEADASPELSAYLKAPTPWPSPPYGRKAKAPDLNRPPGHGDLVQLVNRLQEEAHMAKLSGSVTRCYVFLAGHGVEAQGETCFMFGDYADNGILLSCEELNSALQSYGFSEVLMFLDCCRTSAGRRQFPTRRFNPQADRTVMAVGRAAKRGQKSYEIPHGDGSRGAFTFVLTEGLRGYRRDGELRLEDLRDYVTNRVVTLSGERRQEPQFSGEPTNPDPPLVLARGPGQPLYRDIVITFAPGRAGSTVLLTDDQGEAVGDAILVGSEPVRRAAPIGRLYAIGGKPFRHDGPEDTNVAF